MDIQNVVAMLKDKFGDKIDVAAITEHFKGQDLSKMNINEIIAKVKDAGFLKSLKDLDGDGVEEGLIEELKGKASSMFGGLFGGK